MLTSERPCKICGHRPMKSFAQRLGEMVLALAVIASIILILSLAPGAGS